MKNFIVIFITILFCICNMVAQEQTEISTIKWIFKSSSVEKQFEKLMKSGDYATAEEKAKEGIVLFQRLPGNVRISAPHWEAISYYDLARAFSMQNETEKAIDALQKAKEKKYSYYSKAEQEAYFNNIRNDERFSVLLEQIKINELEKELEKDFLYVLRSAGPYTDGDTTELPTFTYEPASSDSLKKVKDFFNLEAIAGQGDEISQIINLMTWVSTNIPHENHNAPCEKNAIDLYNYHKSTGRGINCRNLATVLNEFYLAMGFKSRFVTCMPRDYKGECHVINSVYSTTLEKWLWMDPSFNSYVKDEKGNLLSIEEVRERLIDGRPLVLNKETNYNGKRKKWLQKNHLNKYMAKNLYWFKCPVNSSYQTENSYQTDRKYVSLCPVGYTPPNHLKTDFITHDTDYFWE